MCKDHYDFYLKDDSIIQLSNEVIDVYNGVASWKVRFKSFLQNCIHHGFDIPMPRYEHFCLEHIYLLTLRRFQESREIDENEVKQVIQDFGIPENENISIMRRMLYSRKADSIAIEPIEKYLLSKPDYPSAMPLWISILGFFVLYFGFKINYFSRIDICNLRGEILLKHFLLSIPIIFQIWIIMYFGLKIPKAFNDLTKRAYDLQLFREPQENTNFLNQVQYVKERNQRAGTYYVTNQGMICGLLTQPFILLLFLGSLSLPNLLFAYSVALVIIPLVYFYNILVLYFPVFSSIGRKNIQIHLFHADGKGGLEIYHRLLFRTFIYNEVFILIVFQICHIWGKWWIFLICLILFNYRIQHVISCISLSIKSIRTFYEEKRKEKQMLLEMSSADGLQKMELLIKVHPLRSYRLILILSTSILLPYIINHLDEWIALSSGFVEKGKFFIDVFKI